MRPPSVQLLRALRATELKSSPAHAVQQATCSLRRFLVGTTSYSSKIIPNALCATRPFASSAIHRSSKTPKSSDRGPPSKEDTQTDFGSMNVLGNTPAPTTAIDACLSDGFHFDNGLKISGGSGCLLVAGEAFDWRPWEAGSRAEGLGKGRMINKKGQWDAETEAWGILDLVWPKPDLLILGLGPNVHPISPKTKHLINSLGVRVDVQDTRNAAAQFNLLATERGVGEVAAALIPVGWKEPK